MDKYMIVFRWLAQVGGASSCMYLTETTMAAAPKPLGQLQYYSYTHCVPAVFIVLLISFKIDSFSYPEYSVIWTPPGPCVRITDILLYTQHSLESILGYLQVFKFGSVQLLGAEHVTFVEIAQSSTKAQPLSHTYILAGLHT